MNKIEENEVITLDNLDTIYLLVYDNLMKGQPNYKRIRNYFINKDEAISFVEEMVVEGYKMYDMGRNPICVYTGNNENKILCHLLKTNKMAFDIIDRIQQLDGLARHAINLDNKSIKNIIVYLVEKDSNLTPYKEEQNIPNGDWVECHNKKYEYNEN